MKKKFDYITFAKELKTKAKELIPNEFNDEDGLYIIDKIEKMH